MSSLFHSLSHLTSGLQKAFQEGADSLREDEIVPAINQSISVANRNAERLDIADFQDAVTNFPDNHLTPFNIAVAHTPYDARFLKSLFPEDSDYQGYQLFNWIMGSPDELSQDRQAPLYTTSYIVYGFQDISLARRTPPLLSEGSFLMALNPTKILVQTNDRSPLPLPPATAAALCVYTSGLTSCAMPLSDPARSLSSLFSKRQTLESNVARLCMSHVLQELVARQKIEPYAAQYIGSHFALPTPHHT